MPDFLPAKTSTVAYLGAVSEALRNPSRPRRDQSPSSTEVNDPLVVSQPRVEPRYKIFLNLGIRFFSFYSFLLLFYTMLKLLVLFCACYGYNDLDQQTRLAIKIRMYSTKSYLLRKSFFSLEKIGSKFVTSDNFLQLELYAKVEKICQEIHQNRRKTIFYLFQFYLLKRKKVS